MRPSRRSRPTCRASSISSTMLAGFTQLSATTVPSTSRINTPSAWSKPQHDAVRLKGRTPAQWAKMAPLCLGKPGDPGRNGRDNRVFVEAVLWIARTGSPWRDLPASLGHWSSVYTRFRDWVKADVWKRLFDAASDEPDMEYAMVDATIVKVHRHGQGAKGGPRAKPSAAPKEA